MITPVRPKAATDDVDHAQLARRLLDLARSGRWSTGLRFLLHAARSSADYPSKSASRDFHQRPDHRAGRAFRLPRLAIFRPRRAGDIEVRPRPPSGEFLQEHRRGDRSRRPARAVQHVGDLALQLLLVFVEQRHRPDLLAGAIGRLRDVIHPRLRRPEQPGRDLAEADDDRRR